ncbi:phosphodiesterase [Rhodococcoides trifolii]|uniref:Phosphodiesterase n=2 Tax=Rhodococcoides trifolii TaxID=908250 RepID=A0A917CXH6_9NOCA|nr:phosphodiesterase [Rhodococcus trifolii]
MPSVLGALGVAGEHDRLDLGVDGIRKACVLLVDGLGYEQLVANPTAAPFLSRYTGRSWTAGFPSTTATSLGSIGTGLPAGEHGVVGYLMALPGFDRPMNPLKWQLHGQADHGHQQKVNMLTAAVPEEIQPRATVFERAAADGITVSRVAPSYQKDSGLTRAVLRGGDFRTVVSAGDLVAEARSALISDDRTLVYAYYADLDLTGHVRGPRSAAWAFELSQVDRIAEGIANELPRDAALIVTADHGMVQVDGHVDIDASPALREGVRMIAGEPRARHVFADAGSEADVLAAWSDLDGYLAVSRGDAIERGWFGPIVTDAVAERIGDVVAVSLGPGALVRRGAEPMQSKLLGHHGSLTSAEMLVPAIVVSHAP